MKRRFSLFTYLVMDMKAAEAELNRRAAKGWRLEKIWMGYILVAGWPGTSVWRIASVVNRVCRKPIR